MSLIKFGKSTKDDSGNIIDIQFGKKLDRINYWKFGEQNQFYFLDTLYHYLPTFVVENDLMNDIMRTIAIGMVKIVYALKRLVGYRTGGGFFAIRKYANDDLQLFINPKKSNDEFITAIKNNFDIHSRRGTLKGISDDVKRFSFDDNAVVEYFNYNECGWILDVTYPEYDNDEDVSWFTNCFIGLDNMLNITIRNKTSYNDTEFMNIIKREFISLNKNVRFFIFKEHVVMFNEIVNGYKVQFGIFKFGEIIE